MSHFDNRLNDAAAFLIPHMEGNDHFQDFSLADRIKDPDGLYAIEAEMTDSDDELTHSAIVREAMGLMAAATPAERLDLFKAYSRRDQDEIASIELGA
ncbi:hypothetical protein ASG87_01410 [Frateuria sp. Soil773]|uniref:hypothetical protein n=1 Tax=Frateuria sp. Soil773 TaxID=1736407 RepID=UPI0006F21CBA|nr:hypothetical protein [Frateuria sp. Soil773]KRE90821.1 hypothetical protein ASG87_01410 [Frateuria sp. Soil773]